MKIEDWYSTYTMADIEQTRRIIPIICAAILMSLVTYVGMTWFLARQGTFARTGDGTLPAVVIPMLIAIGVSMLVVAEVSFRSLLSRIRGLESVDERMARLRVAIIVAFAFRESTALVGLVSFFVTGDPRVSYAMCALAALAMIAGWPRESLFDEVTASGPRPIG